MPNDTITRWTVSVSKDTDIAVRTFLAQRGMKKGDLSKFRDRRERGGGQAARRNGRRPDPSRSCRPKPAPPPVPAP
jgi:hypothetical protein